METPGESVEIAFVDQAYTGDTPAQEAKEHGIQLEVVKLPRRWVVERSFAWTTRFRRLVRDYERLPATLAGLHLVVFACLMLHHWITLSRHEQSFRPPPSLLTKNGTHPRNPVC